jgi:hypothetical protein
MAQRFAGPLYSPPNVLEDLLLRSVIRLALRTALLTPAAAYAESIGPAQAQALQQQLKDWLSGLLGPSVKVPDLPVQITGEQDHYKFAVHVPGFEGPDGDVASTANVRPLDGGRWSIDSVKAPDAGSFTVTLPKTDDPDSGGPMKMHFTIGKQDSHGVIDPTLATDSNFHTEFGALVMQSENPKQTSEQRIDRYVTDATLKPRKDGRLDFTSTGTMEGWKSANEVNGQTPVAFGAEKVQATGHVEGINRAHVADLLAASGALFGAMPDHAKDSDLTPAARAQVRLMLAAMQDLVTAVSIEETLDGVQVEIAGMGGGTIKHLKMGFGGEAPDGMLHAWLDIGLDGLESPSMPPKIAGYLPRHFEIKPSLSGVKTADLQKLAQDSVAENGGKDVATADFMAMLSHGGANANLEILSFDLGPAKVDGTGHFTATSPSQWHGDAHVTATGFDDLMKQAHDDQELAQALPVMIMLRGMAKPVGNQLVWDVVSDGPKLTVNGMDMSALTGGADKPKAKPQATKPGPGAKPGQGVKP